MFAPQIPAPSPAPTLLLLGPAQMAGEGAPQPLPDDRIGQLLVYLAVTGPTVARRQAASALWPLLDAQAAYRNLRKTLHRLRASRWSAAMQADADRLRLAIPTDLQRFDAALAAGRPEAALELCRGLLADGLGTDGADAAGGWLAAAREHRLSQWRNALVAALPQLPPDRAEAELQRLRQLDPLDESLARAHLKCLQDAGRHDAFQRTRAAFARALAEELGVVAPPDLAAEPLAGPPAPASPAAGADVPPRQARGTLFGREEELERLQAWLAEPGACVSLRGPGGIGKTRLAAELATLALRQGLAVVWWRLADTSDPDQAAARLAAELGMDDAREARLAARLARVPALLVADNAEHLLAAGFAERLHALRSAAHHLRTLVTSRSPVDGTREFMLAALDVPDPADPPGAVLRNPAVRLFTERARALDAGFDPPLHVPALGRIARAADGHALALELAAGRVRQASPEEIAQALEDGAGDLDALFGASWRALPEALRPGWAALAALPPSFDRSIAEAACGLRPSAFDALAARSLVERSGARWRLHPLLRHWLQTEHPSPATAARAAAAALAALDARLARAGHDHIDTIRWAEAEQELLVLALWQAVQSRDAGSIGRLVSVIGVSAESHGRRAQAMALMSEAADRLAGAPLAVRAPVQAQRAVQLFRAGRLDDAASLAAMTARGATGRWRAVAIGVQAMVAFERGDCRAARQAQRRMQALALDHGQEDLLCSALNLLAAIDDFEQQHAAAERGYRRVAEMAALRGAHRLQTIARTNLATLLHGTGRSAAARAELATALALVREHGLASLELAVLVQLGSVQLALGELDELRRGLPAMRQLLTAGERLQRVRVEGLEMQLHVRSGQVRQAWPFARAAWSVAVAIDQRPLLRALAVHGAEAWACAGERERALAWLAWARGQPDLWHEDRREAERQWKALQPTAAESAAAEAAAAALSLEDLGHAIEAA